MRNLWLVILAGLTSVLVLNLSGEWGKIGLTAAYLFGCLYFIWKKKISTSGKNVISGLAFGWLMLLVWQVMVYIMGWGIWLGAGEVNWLDWLFWMSVNGFILLFLSDRRLGSGDGWKERILNGFLALFWLMFLGVAGWWNLAVTVLLWYWLFTPERKVDYGVKFGWLAGFYVWQAMANFHIISDELQADGWIGPNSFLVVYWLVFIWWSDGYFIKNKEA